MFALDDSLSKTRVELYTTSTAPDIKTKKDCYRLRALLEAKKIIFTEIDLASHLWKRRQMLARSGGFNALPQLHAYGKFLGDLSRVQELEDFGELDDAIQSALEEATLPSVHSKRLCQKGHECRAFSDPIRQNSNSSASSSQAASASASASESQYSDSNAANGHLRVPGIGHQASRQASSSKRSHSEASETEHSSALPSPPSSPLRGIQSTGSFEYARQSLDGTESSATATSTELHSEQGAQLSICSTASSASSGTDSDIHGLVFANTHQNEQRDQAGAEYRASLPEGLGQLVPAGLTVQPPASPVAQEEEFYTPGWQDAGEAKPQQNPAKSPASSRPLDVQSAHRDAGHLWNSHSSNEGIKPRGIQQPLLAAESAPAELESGPRGLAQPIPSAESAPPKLDRVSSARGLVAHQKPKRRSSCGIIRGADRALEDAESSGDDSLDPRFQIVDTMEALSLSNGRTTPAADSESFEFITYDEADSMSRAEGRPPGLSSNPPSQAGDAHLNPSDRGTATPSEAGSQEQLRKQYSWNVPIQSDSEFDRGDWMVEVLSPQLGPPSE